ncbi:urea ABC transporter ATP-binding subunit UrtE [Rhodobacteraceae bacterium N5(2021)]|uniref:Urea ABC transporter ATP-binding subunit UrtE n=1 Tax=Gymnodinialimonas phycosphaerae TaxID=2841589 RepID=A0A975TXQ2_9RHOB|nr:urea ABC transporter ATP-binding subunit UrtE [Gymnodinialimonas phycosphaerae]MBY4892468.1 urea ABC transporter ATP-binding subunit UrtE [Gymnodinialimonas phycosphaerae]
MLETRDLTLHYGGSKILNGISVQAAKGEVTCVMGTNGVGKTSLMKAIAGTHARSGGEVLLDGVAVPKLPAHRLAQMGVACVPQGRMIFPLLTVRENLETGLACLPKGAREVPERIYEMFPVLREMEGRRGGDLSGGQQQQLAIGRALVTKPKLLLMDEPTEGIQPNIIQLIGRVIAQLRDEGEMAIVLVEQYFDFAFDLADRFYVLKRGETVFSSAKADTTRDQVQGAFSL